MAKVGLGINLGELVNAVVKKTTTLYEKGMAAKEGKGSYKDALLEFIPFASRPGEELSEVMKIISGTEEVERDERLLNRQQKSLLEKYDRTKNARFAMVFLVSLTDEQLNKLVSSERDMQIIIDVKKRLKGSVGTPGVKVGTSFTARREREKKDCMEKCTSGCIGPDGIDDTCSLDCVDKCEEKGRWNKYGK
jgi:hypothetical protein